MAGVWVFQQKAVSVQYFARIIAVISASHMKRERTETVESAGYRLIQITVDNVLIKKAQEE